MDQLRRQREAVRPGRRQAFGTPGSSRLRRCKHAIALSRLVVRSPFVHLLQAQDGLRLAVVLVGVNVEDVLARSRQRTFMRERKGWSVSLLKGGSSPADGIRSLQGEEGLLEPRAADHYIPLCV